MRRFPRLSLRPSHVHHRRPRGRLPRSLVERGLLGVVPRAELAEHSLLPLLPLLVRRVDLLLPLLLLERPLERALRQPSCRSCSSSSSPPSASASSTASSSCPPSSSSRTARAEGGAALEWPRHLVRLSEIESARGYFCVSRPTSLRDVQYHGILPDRKKELFRIGTRSHEQRGDAIWQTATGCVAAPSAFCSSRSSSRWRLRCTRQ